MLIKPDKVYKSTFDCQMCGKIYSVVIDYKLAHSEGVACPQCGHVWDIIPQDTSPPKTKREIRCLCDFCKNFTLEEWNNAKPGYLWKLLRKYRENSR